MGSAIDRLDARGREKVKCELCDMWYHRLDVHLQQKHSMSVDVYSVEFPGCSVLSETARAIESKKTRNVKKSKVSTRKPTPTPEGIPEAKKPEVKKENSDIFRIGVASLKRRTDLTDNDKGLQRSAYDDNWLVDETVMELWEDVAVGIEDNEPIFIGGPTGCGKTASIEMLAAAIEQPVRRIQLNRDFKVSQFVGRPELKIDADGNQYTEFKYGVLPEAIKNGWWLLLDEIDQAHPDVLMALQAVLEGRPLVLTENFGEVVDPMATERSKNFRIIATANTFGRGDESGLYVGAKLMNEATMDRFGVTIKAEYPKMDSEIKIIMNKSGVKIGEARKMVNVAHKVREAAANELCNCTFSTRRLIMWARKHSRYNDIRRAAKVSILNKLSDADDANFVNNLIQRHFGGEVS